MGAPWRWRPPSNNLGGWYRRQTTTGRRWQRTCPGKGIFGVGCCTSSAGRERRRGCLDYFLRPWYRRYCYLDRRHGWLPPAWARTRGGFRPRWRDGWRDGYRGGHRTEGGDTPRRRRQGRRWDSWRWRSISGCGRTQLHSTSLHYHC